MGIIESRDALGDALLDIAKEAEKRGLKAETKCFVADHDLNEVSEENISSASLIAGEISLSAEGTEEKMLLECAVSVNDGEVSSDEIANEVNVLRRSMKEICDKFDELGNAKDTFAALTPEEEPAPKEPVYDNKKFYIIGGIVAVVALVLVMLLK